MVQDKQLLSPKEKTTSQKLWWVIKLVITVLILSYIYTTFHHEEKGFSIVLEELTGLFENKNLPRLFLLLLLVPANWALESLKWQGLAKKAIPITFSEALRSTLTGLAIGVAVPAQLGDTLGRVGSLRSSERLKAIGAAVVSNGIQFYVSLLAGGISWYFIKDTLNAPTWISSTILFITLILVVAGVAIAYFRKSLLIGDSNKKWLERFRSYLEVIAYYTLGDLARALILGLLRYLVFLFQFVLAISLFNTALDWVEITAGVALILLAKTLIPALNVFGDLGLREFTALYVFKNYSMLPEKIVAATLLIWFINILGPLLIGIVLVWRYKWKNS
jgi:uncharacterized membrane protein YbhN (UPF0104 family)